MGPLRIGRDDDPANCDRRCRRKRVAGTFAADVHRLGRKCHVGPVATALPGLRWWSLARGRGILLTAMGAPTAGRLFLHGPRMTGAERVRHRRHGDPESQCDSHACHHEVHVFILVTTNPSRKVYPSAAAEARPEITAFDPHGPSEGWLSPLQGALDQGRGATIGSSKATGSIGQVSAAQPTARSREAMICSRIAFRL